MKLAAKGVAYAMKDFIMAATGKTLNEVNMPLSAAGNLRFCQVVDPLVT